MPARRSEEERDRPGGGDDAREHLSSLRLGPEVHAVIGAGDGIGRETARALSAAGATVLCVDIDPAWADRVAGETGGLAARCDVTREGELDRVLADAERDAGPIAGVTNIVGMTLWKRLEESTEEDWLWQNEIVAGQALRTLRVATPFLRRAGGGCMSFVASVSAFTSAPGHGLYGMSKAALRSMARTAAIELGPLGIRVNTVSPGATRTPRLVADPRFDEPLRDNALRTPLGKLAEPGDIAATLLFLASPLAGHITGQDITVDGGLTNAWPLATPEGD